MQKNIFSAGIIPVIREKKHRQYLLLRVYNYWDFPKGIVEKNEDFWQAALRELKEETGIQEAKDLLHGHYFETAPYSIKGKIARYYLAEVPTQKVILAPNPETGIQEHHEFRWLTYEQARALLVPRVQAALDWAEEKIKLL